jgi:succinate dehydrogenase / fumarate reductase iron-sulfur subunit
VIRDLVVDFDPVAEKEKNFKPWLIERDDRHDHLQSQSDFHKIAAPADCIMCGMCASECRELNYETGNYPGPFILNKVYRYLRDSRDGAHEERVHVVLDNDLWKCIHCQQCTTKCAKKIPIADEISFMRRQALSMGETNSMGARHAYSFYNDVRKTGKLNETMLALHTEGMYKTLKNRIPFAMRMVVAGKMNPLDMPRPIKGIKDVRKLYEFSQTIQKED